MPINPYQAPQYILTDAEELEALKETLQNLILIRRDILAKPKPTYEIDGQIFKWNEYLDTLNKAINQVRADLRTADGPLEEETTASI